MTDQALLCPGCQKVYRAPSFGPDRSYVCRQCGRPLETASSPSESAQEVGNTDPLLGKQIGQYKIISKLGEGGMGAVYKAEHVGLRRPSALKLLPQHKAHESARAVQRFMREARAAAALDHPNIVPVFNVGEADGWHFIDMQFVDGESVQERLQRDGKLSIEEATRILTDVARALAEAHSEGIVHRDIKPANILLDKHGSVRVADFGLAKSIEGEDSLVTLEGKAGIGTPSFMSPEQCDGLELSGRSDIYSLGVTYYFLLTGDLPFRGNTSLEVMRQHRTEPTPDPRGIVPGLPESACRIIEKAMAKNPGDRFQSCGELVAALSGASVGHAASVSGVFVLPTPLSGLVRRIRQLPRAAGASVVLVSAACLALWTTWPPPGVYEPVGTQVPLPLAEGEPRPLSVRRVSAGEQVQSGGGVQAFRWHRPKGSRSHAMALWLNEVDLSAATQIRLSIRAEGGLSSIAVVLRDQGSRMSDSVPVARYCEGPADDQGFHDVCIPAGAFKASGWDMKPVRLVFIQCFEFDRTITVRGLSAVFR